LAFYVKEKLGYVDFLGLELLRGDYNKDNVSAIKPEQFLKIIEFIEDQNRNEKNIYKRLISPFYYRLCLDILKEKKQVIDCKISAFYPVIDAWGNVYPCENREKIANLRDYDYNLASVWQTEKAKLIRKSVKKKECFCTHSCYQIPNIYLSPKMIIKIIKGKY
jgi:MoaA/NifB/PqqE/SkfB family radical SAM enzyme